MLTKINVINSGKEKGMDGFEEKVSKILSNPQALEQVMSIAKGLGSAQGREDDEPRALPHGLTPAEGPENALMSLVSGLDPRMLSGLMELAGEFGKKDDKRTHLLNALRPYVREERRGKIDRAAQYVVLARIARRALGMFGGGGIV